MRKRAIKKQFWLNENENKMLKEKSKKTGLSEAEYLRCLIEGYNPKEKPDEEFYKIMRNLRAIGNNLNQIARNANAYGVIDTVGYKKNCEKMNKFIADIRYLFLD